MFEGTYATPAYLDAPTICGDCGSRTPLDEMATRRRCKKCEARRRAEWYQANKAACNARNRRWKRRNPERAAEHRRRYYLKTGR